VHVEGAARGEGVDMWHEGVAEEVGPGDGLLDSSH
jgi:hypothetical protein